MNNLTIPTRRVRRAVVLAALATLTLAGPGAAAQPTITKVDFSQFEPFAEADWTAECGFVVDVEFEGHIIFRELSGGRFFEINTWRAYQSYSANGKTFVAPRTAGPDMLWTAGDGTTYLAIVGRSPADGMIGRLVLDDGTGDVVASHGREIDNPFDDVCAALAP